jgi:hypothetical protein
MLFSRLRARIWQQLPLLPSAYKPSFLFGGSIPLPPSVRFRFSLWKEDALDGVRAVAAAEHATNRVKPLSIAILIPRVKCPCTMHTPLS